MHTEIRQVCVPSCQQSAHCEGLLGRRQAETLVHVQLMKEYIQLYNYCFYDGSYITANLDECGLIMSPSSIVSGILMAVLMCFM
jgi:hypothetical protein